MHPIALFFKSRPVRSILLILLVGFVHFAPSPAARSEPPAAQLGGTTDGKLVNKEAILKAIADHQGKGRVIVHLKPPPNAPAVVDYNDLRSETSYRTANREHEDAIIARLPGSDATLVERFENQPTLVVDVTEAGLKTLQDDGDVVLIAPVVEMQLLTAQGLPLVGSVRYRSASPSFNGAGVSIAIVDTGIDCTHPELGQTGYPNVKVLGGRDYGSFDYDPVPDGGDALWAHGTNCAGIAAGDIPPGSPVPGLDYVGGVAPGARLYSLKVQPDLCQYKVALAWDWVLTHRNDDPANPILVISNSLGFGRYFTECSWDGENWCMSLAAQYAVNVGITLFAGAGNDGYCDSIRAPACLSNVISVGAVYDDNIGRYPPCWIFGCVASPTESCIALTSLDIDCIPGDDACPCGGCFLDLNTWAGLVPSYSDSSPLVNLLAPAEACVTTDLTGEFGRNTNNLLHGGDFTEGAPGAPFGGTSAACAYAAGAAAVLQSATLAVKGSRLTSGQVRDYLEWTGTDTPYERDSVWYFTPRINLNRAIEMAIGTWVDFGYSGPETGIVTQPFNTLAEAVVAAPDDGLINLQAGSTTETITIAKPVTLRSFWGGTVTIGQ